MQHLIRHTFYVYSCHFPLIVYISQWCTITLLLLHALFVNVGRSDKKDSCGALYFEKVSSLSIEGTQPLSVSSCWFYLSSPGRQLYKTLCIFKNCLREKEHSNSTRWAWQYSQIRKREWPLEKGKIKIAASGAPRLMHCSSLECCEHVLCFLCSSPFWTFLGSDFILIVLLKNQ